MLEHSRTSTAERPPANLNKLAEEYLRLAYQGLRAKDKTFNAELKTDFDPALPHAGRGEPTRPGYRISHHAASLSQAAPYL